MTDRLAIEFISVLGLPPVEFVKLARDLGVSHIGLAPQPISANPHGYPAWSLLEDGALVRDTVSALRDHGVTVSVGEGFLLREGLDLASLEPALDLFARLGAPVVNAVNMAPSPELFAGFARLSAERGMTATVEFLPMMPPADFRSALAFVEQSGVASAGLMVDAMHFFRGGSAIGELVGPSAERIAYVQLCDVPMPAHDPDYGAEARNERRAPGEGDLPLAAFLAALPREPVIGLEVPQVSKAAAGIGPADRLRPAIAQARALIDAMEPRL